MASSMLRGIIKNADNIRAWVDGCQTVASNAEKFVEQAKRLGCKCEGEVDDNNVIHLRIHLEECPAPDLEVVACQPD